MKPKTCDGEFCHLAIDCYLYHLFISDPQNPSEPDADWRVFADEHKALMYCRDFKRYKEEDAKPKP